MIMKQAVLICMLIFVIGCTNKKEDPEPPNILWIVVEDMSSNFGYQGEALVTTPHINQLAKQGVVFANNSSSDIIKRRNDEFNQYI